MIHTMFHKFYRFINYFLLTLNFYYTQLIEVSLILKINYDQYGPHKSIHFVEQKDVYLLY